MWEKTASPLLASKQVENLRYAVGWTSSQLESNIGATLAEEACETGSVFGLKRLTKRRGAEANVQQGKEFWFVLRGSRKALVSEAQQGTQNTCYNFCAS